MTTLGSRAQLGIDSSYPVRAEFEFSTCSLTRRDTLQTTPATRGQAPRAADRVAYVEATVAGRIEMYPSVAEWAQLLAWINSTTAERRYVTVDRGVQVTTYVGCVVQRATIAGNLGEPIRLTIDLLGQSTVTTPAGTFPAVASLDGPPLLFANSQLQLAGMPRQTERWSLTIDNDLLVTRGFALEPAAINLQQRRVSLQCRLPYDAAQADLLRAAPTALAALVECAGSTGGLRCVLPCTQLPLPEVFVRGAQPIWIDVTAEAFAPADGSDLTLTLTGA